MPPSSEHPTPDPASSPASGPASDPASDPTSDPGEGALLDVVGLGSPLVDVLAIVHEDLPERMGLTKGSMELVDLARAEAIYAALGPAVEVSGGSAANTLAGVASLGGTAGFVGKVADDELGRVFAHDIRSVGVEFYADHLFVPPGTGPAGNRDRGAGGGAEAQGTRAQGGPGGAEDSERLGTGRCLVLVTPDAERTMATHLGVATTISPTDVPAGLVGRGRLVYLEGYLWDLPPAKEAMRQAISVAHDSDGSVALSLSDPLCARRHRQEFLELVAEDVDVLFGNEEEVTGLFGVSSLARAVQEAEETGVLCAITRGPKGAVVLTARGPLEVPAHPVSEVVDTTGAGDLFAAGFLWGLARGEGPERCARLGALCAAEVIGHLGARPQRSLAELAHEAGLD